MITWNRMLAALGALGLALFAGNGCDRQGEEGRGGGSKSPTYDREPLPPPTLPEPTPPTQTPKETPPEEPQAPETPQTPRETPEERPPETPQEPR